MADIVKENGPFVSIEGADGSTAIANDHSLKSGHLYSICLKPGGSSDRLVIKDNDTDGPYIMDVTVTATTEEQIVYFHGAAARVFLDISECSLSAGAKVMIQYRRLNY